MLASRFFRSAAFIFLCAIWGSTWLAIRIGLEAAPPFPAASLRFVVASLNFITALVAVLLGATVGNARGASMGDWVRATKAPHSSNLILHATSSISRREIP